MMEDRYQRGWDKLMSIDTEAIRRVVDAMEGVAPDLARFVVEFPYGDVFSRPGLALRSREMITVAALCALGNAEPQLKVHMNAALNVGVTRTEIVEIVLQMAVYAGFAVALAGMAAAREVFSQREAQGITN
ncbi:MAG: carboxymuconolactone decarboxylase family protein [Thermodesulfobacteriota bacterium]